MDQNHVAIMPCYCSTHHPSLGKRDPSVSSIHRYDYLRTTEYFQPAGRLRRSPCAPAFSYLSLVRRRKLRAHPEQVPFIMLRHNLVRLTGVTRCADSTRFPPARFHSGAYDCFAAICRIVSRLRPCGDGFFKEPWAAGAAPAGGSSSPGHSAAAVPTGLRNPPFPNMGFCSRPGEDPNAFLV